MFGFLFHKKRNDVRRILQGRRNCKLVRQINPRDRRNDRGAFSEVVWVVPCDPETGRRECGSVYPAVTKDICPDGLSLIHTGPVEFERVVIGLPGDSGLHFLLCTVEHSTPLGHGFYQIGLSPEELVPVERRELLTMRERMLPAAAQPVATGA